MAYATKAIAEQRGDDVAMVDDLGSSTWSQFDDRVDRLIHVFRSAGLSTGDTVALMCGNRREFFEVLTAASHSGLYVVPVNWHWVAEEVAYVIDDSDAVAFVVEGRFLDVAVAACADDRTSRCRLRLAVVGDGAGGADVVAPMPDSFTSYESALAGAEASEPEDQVSGSTMFYTSGTTGFPKGVRSTASSLGHDPALVQLVAQGGMALLHLPPDGVTLLAGPGYHSAQWAFSFLPLLGGTSKLVMRQKFDAAELLRDIDEHGVTNVHLVPTQFTRLLKLPDDVKTTFDGSSLVNVVHGAAPCPPEVKRRMIEWWGPVISEYYGGTEGGFLTMIDAASWLEKPGSLGQPVPGAELLVIDPDGNECAPGEAGQIYFRSATRGDFEYHKAPEKTAAAHLASGFATLGDIGYVDEDGFLFLSDRKIDMIISGGVNIYPAEIEGVLVGHPSVADAAVFGIPDDEMGEQVKAAVELVDGVDPSPELEADLVAHVRTHLAGYKAPRSVDFVDKLPRHPTGKLYKRLLRDPYWEGSGRTI